MPRLRFFFPLSKHFVVPAPCTVEHTKIRRIAEHDEISRTRVLKESFTFGGGEGGVRKNRLGMYRNFFLEKFRSNQFAIWQREILFIQKYKKYIKFN